MFSERIKILRESHGLTQEQLARKLGISKQSLSGWETDYAMPSVNTLVDVATFFGVSTDYLLGLDKEETIDISLLNESEKKLVYMLVLEFKDNKKK